MPKPNVTRTLGPIHFEDLEPHRFEDLVRQLLYDYKDWQSIEATGRSGNDAGFDIRAYEKNLAFAEADNDDEDETVTPHPMEGNLWKIQCKRESVLGPGRVKGIIEDGVSSEGLPYGYILVAPANFSRKSYEVFREELRIKGVMEFFLLGKAELEDMLLMPKYDRILFTFFGISLVVKQRSKVAEIRSFVQMKNKVMKLFGDNPAGQKVLFKDINDIHYPQEKKYPDFDVNPRWKQFSVAHYSVTGFYVEVAAHIAYFDSLKDEWDYDQSLDMNKLKYSDEGDEKIREQLFNKQSVTRNFLSRFPLRTEETLYVWGLVKYQDILYIDEKGDISADFPHFYFNKPPNNNLFSRFTKIIGHGFNAREIQSKHKRIKIFPDKYPAIKKGKFHEKNEILISREYMKGVEGYSVKAFFGTSDTHSFLKHNDTVTLRVADTDSKIVVRFRVKYKQTLQEYLSTNPNQYKNSTLIHNQLGASSSTDKPVYIYEFDSIY